MRLDLATLVLFVAGAEVGLRAFAPGTERLIVTDKMTGGYPVTLNGRGQREREFPTERPADEERILCLGDSTTWGTAVAVEDTYPKQLEAMLNRAGGRTRFFAINAGGQGNSPHKVLSFLRSEGLKYEARVVILAFSPSMLSQIAETPAAKASASFVSRLKRVTARAVMNMHVALHGSYTYALWDELARKGLYRLGILKDRPDRPGGALMAYAFDQPTVSRAEVERLYSELSAKLRELKALLDQAGVRLVVVGIPSRFVISHLAVDNERGLDLTKMRINPMQRLAEDLAGIQVPFIDLTPRLKLERQTMLSGSQSWNDLYVYDYTHPNQRGYQIVAEELVRLFTGRAWITAVGL